ncbi:MAG: hypothetical protein K6F91_03185 [Ruminococcus sp.]|nr:hypothetical protein [Ruminococcus sp.]
MLEKMLCLVIMWMQKLFNVFTGIEEVQYNKKNALLIDVFFNNTVIQNIYWGMAAIGIVLIFTFAIMAVVKKMFDLDDKVKQSYGQILRSILRGILVIVSMNLVITISISFTNYLMDAVNEVFDNGENLVGNDPHIEYTDEQYATMSRIFNTVGNYSLNPSYKNRYNINACYNEIRGDLKKLADEGVFDFYYNDYEKKQVTVKLVDGGSATLNVNDENKKINTWQSVLQEIYNAGDVDKELAADVYDEKVAKSLDNCMTVLKSDPSFHALDHYDKDKYLVNQDVPLDRVLFLIGTMGIGDTAAARNDAYNKEPSMFDNVRGPYYSGDRDIYTFEQVNGDFDPWIGKTNYIVVYFAGMLLIANMAIIAVNCIVRIFNLIFLYLIAPPIVAASPLDDGGKFRQWIIAFVIQLFSVFATVISMRVFLVYIPIVINPALKLSSNILIDSIGKLVMIWAGTKAVEKSNGLLTGILADMAGHQSLMAGDMSNAVKGSAIGQAAAAAKGKFEGAVTSAALAPAKLGLGAAKGVAKTVGRAAALPFRPITGAVKNAGKWINHGLSLAEKATDNAILSSPEASAEAAKKQAEQIKNNPNFQAKPNDEPSLGEPSMNNLTNPGGGGGGGNDLPDMNNALGNNFGGDAPEMPNNAGEALQDALHLGGGGGEGGGQGGGGEQQQQPLPQQGGGGERQQQPLPQQGGGIQQGQPPQGGNDAPQMPGGGEGNPPDMPANNNGLADNNGPQDEPQGGPQGGPPQGGPPPQGPQDGPPPGPAPQMPQNNNNIPNMPAGNNNVPNAPVGNNNNNNDAQRPVRRPPPPRGGYNQRQQNLFGIDAQGNYVNRRNINNNIARNNVNNNNMPNMPNNMNGVNNAVNNNVPNPPVNNAPINQPPVNNVNPDAPGEGLFNAPRRQHQLNNDAQRRFGNNNNNNQPPPNNNFLGQ